MVICNKSSTAAQGRPPPTNTTTTATVGAPKHTSHLQQVTEHGRGDTGALITGAAIYGAMGASAAQRSTAQHSTAQQQLSQAQRAAMQARQYSGAGLKLSQEQIDGWGPRFTADRRGADYSLTAAGAPALPLQRGTAAADIATRTVWSDIPGQEYYATAASRYADAFGGDVFDVGARLDRTGIEAALARGLDAKEDLAQTRARLQHGLDDLIGKGVNLGAGVSSVVRGMTGAASMDAARVEWNAGNYGSFALYGAQAFVEAGLTVAGLGAGVASAAVRGVTAWEVAAARGAYGARGEAEGIGFTRRQLQHGSKHAGDFGIAGNPNNKTFSEFSTMIQNHVVAPGTQVIQGTYRGQSVTHFVDPGTGLNVIRDASGNFLSGWKLSPQQLEHVLKNGKLGGS